MEPTIQDELREICDRKNIGVIGCTQCAYEERDCTDESCFYAAADTLLAALDTRRLEIVRKGEK